MNEWVFAIVMNDKQTWRVMFLSESDLICNVHFLKRYANIFTGCKNVYSTDLSSHKTPKESGMEMFLCLK